jgi:hypothetical protein
VTTPPNGDCGTLPIKIPRRGRETRLAVSNEEAAETGRLRRALLCCSGASCLIMLASNIVAVSLPTMARDMHAAFSGIEWVVSAHVLCFAAMLLPAGPLAAGTSL